MNVPPAINQPVAVALAFRLVSVPADRIIPADAGMATVDVVAATEEVPKTRLKVLAAVSVPKTADALPVTVNVSGVAVPPDPVAAAYVTNAVALNAPPAIVQLEATPNAFKLVSTPLEITRPVVAATPFSAVFPSFKLSVLTPKTAEALPVTVNFSRLEPLAAA